jgi:glycerophosphoryl diester phosphodiesterase
MPLVLGHRGVPGAAPENTIDGFKLAMAMGAHGVELDVHLSRDGELVVIHDELLDRTTDGAGPVGSFTLAELKRLNAAARFPGGHRRQAIPTLDEVVDAVGPAAVINVEIKSGVVLYPEIERTLAEFIDARALAQRVIVSSFNHYSLVEFKRLAPAVDVGLLYTAGLVEPWLYARRVGAQALHPLHFSVTPELVSASHDCGVKVNPWTPNSEEHIRRVAGAGVDAIITNRPDLALKVLGGSRE